MAALQPTTRAACVVLELLFLLWPLGAPAQDSASNPGTEARESDTQKSSNAGSSKQKLSPNLTNLSLEELMSIEVEVQSAARKPEQLSQAAAAIFVLTAEDIRRGGFSSLPEALRTVPGLYVAKVNEQWWTVSARGFSDYLNNKMLVLVDGRSVYTPQFGGVYWGVQDVPLEDVERIEVIRGPGGTLWGANAINGVINIITRKAEDTQGISLVTSAGIDDGYALSVRDGGRIGGRVQYRVFAKGDYREPGFARNGSAAYDAANLAQAGTRLDWSASDKDTLTVEGGGYQGGLQNEEYAFPGPGLPKTALFNSARLRGGHFLSHWTHRFSPLSSTQLSGYCDWTDRISFATEARNTCQVEFQHNLQFAARHSLVWGGSAATSTGTTYQSFTVQGVPAQQRTATESIFGQYELTVIPDRLRVIAGTKIEHNAYTGIEIQPQIRGVWSPKKAHTVWAAVSRAVRTPTRMENQEQVKLTQLPAPVPMYLTVVGNPNLKAEVLRAYEIGYRFEPAPAFSLDAAVFYNHYDDLSNVNLVHPLAVAGPRVVHQNPTYVEIPVPWQNLGPGQTHGAELYAKFMPIRRWMLASAVTELRGNSVNLADSLNLPVANTPKHQFNLQSRLNLKHQIELDSALFHYDGIPRFVFGGIPLQDVPTHNRIDAGIAFHRRGGFTFSVWAHDLASDRHWENRPALFTTTGSQTGRSIVFRFSWQPQREP